MLIDSGVGVSDLVLTLCLAWIDSGVGVSDLVLMLCLARIASGVECQNWC